jgi:hypothetical protein
MGKPGPGARLETRFLPAAHWGAEFLAQEARLCAFARKDGKPVLTHAFAGSYAEADAFARTHGLAYEGLHAAISHLPFKIESIGPAPEGGEDDLNPHAERAKPQGMALASLEAQAFPIGDDRCLVLAREDALRAFTAQLPPSLAALWDLAPSPIALMPHLDAARALGHWAALLADADAIHILFFQDAFFLAYAKVFSGWEAAGRDAAGFAREMKKALVYHFGSRFAGAALASLQIWRDGPAGEIAVALKGLGIPQFVPDWGPLAEVPPPFRVAAALAFRGSQASEAAMSFAVAPPAAAAAKRAWMRRAGTLARFGGLALACLALAAGLLGASAAGLRWTVQAKARTWSGELQRWEFFQQRKSAVEAELEGMQGILSRRTTAFAVLQEVAGSLPPETWLERWELESKGGRLFAQRLEGYVLTEARVPEFLANLEKAGMPGALKLKSTERIKAESVEQKTGIQANRRDLVRFQIGTSP